jgi:hypothetical protein
MPDRFLTRIAESGPTIQATAYCTIAYLVATQ